MHAPHHAVRPASPMGPTEAPTGPPTGPPTELRTARLVLRQWRSGDLDALAGIDGDPEVMRYIGDGSVRTRAQTETALQNIQRQWDEHGFGLLAAEHLATGELIGWIGLAVPNFLPDVLPAVEVGWRLARRWWGQGLATEGARAVIADGFERVGLDEIISIRQPDNVASGRLMDKLGLRFARHAVIPGRGADVVVTALRRDDWRAARDAHEV